VELWVAGRHSMWGRVCWGWLNEEAGKALLKDYAGEDWGCCLLGGVVQ
jgi:hypothetical protein